MLTRYGLVPLQQNAVVNSEDGKAEIQLGLSKELSFLTKLKSSQHDEEELQRYVMQRVIADRVVFTVTPPCVGEYGLEIYCRDPRTDGNILYNTCQYLIVCNEVKAVSSPLPVLPTNYLGAQLDYKNLGLTLIGDPDPFIQSEGPEMNIVFELSKPLIVLSQLIYVSNNQTQDCSSYILQQVQGKQLTLSLRMPRVGLYKHQIYAVAAADPSNNLPCVYNFLINCQESNDNVQPFPKQYSQFKDSCFLL